MVTSSSSSGWGPPSADKGDCAIVDADGRDLEVVLRLRDDKTAGAIMLDDVWLR